MPDHRDVLVTRRGRDYFMVPLYIVLSAAIVTSIAAVQWWYLDNKFRKAAAPLAQEALRDPVMAVYSAKDSLIEDRLSETQFRSIILSALDNETVPVQVAVTNSLLQVAGSGAEQRIKLGEVDWLPIQITISAVNEAARAETGRLTRELSRRLGVPVSVAASFEPRADVKTSTVTCYDRAICSGVAKRIEDYIKSQPYRADLRIAESFDKEAVPSPLLARPTADGPTLTPAQQGQRIAALILSRRVDVELAVAVAPARPTVRQGLGTRRRGAVRRR